MSEELNAKKEEEKKEENKEKINESKISEGVKLNEELNDNNKKNPKKNLNESIQINEDLKKEEEEYGNYEFEKNNEELKKEEKKETKQKNVENKNEIKNESQIVKDDDKNKGNNENENKQEENNNENNQKENNELKKEEEDEYGKEEFIKENETLPKEENIKKDENIDSNNKNEENIVKEKIKNESQIILEDNNNKNNNDKNEEDEYGKEEFIKGNEESPKEEKNIDDNNIDKNIKLKNESQIILDDNKNIEINENKEINIINENKKKEEKEKKEKVYIEEFKKELENDNDNAGINDENNVSDFLEKDNVHLGPIIEKSQEQKEDNDNNNNDLKENNINKKENIDKEKENKIIKDDNDKKEEEEEKKEDNKEEEKKEENINKVENKEAKKEGEGEEKKEDYDINNDDNNKNREQVKMIMNQKRNSSKKNSELMSETEILKMSMNEEKKEGEEKKEEQAKESEIKEGEVKVDEVKKDEKKDNNLNEKEEIKEEENNDIGNEEEKVEEKEENDKKEEEKNISIQDTESLIDSILLKEYDELSDVEEIKPIKKKKKTKIKEDIKKNYITINKLEKNPNKRIKVDSPRSLKVINENGYTLEELYYCPFEIFLKKHKETLNMKKSEQIIRYNFYEEFRLKKIKTLCELRDKLIEDEELKKHNKKLELENMRKREELNIINKYENKKISQINDENNLSKYKTVNLASNDIEKIKNNDNDNDLVKKIILENEERIMDNKLDRMKAVNDKELANVVEFELNKNLFKLQLEKQSENFNKDIKKLKYENYMSPKHKDLPNSGNQKPIVNKETKFNDNLISFHVAKRKKDYDIFSHKLEQKLEKVEMANKKKNEEYLKKKKMEDERAKLNLKKSSDIFNKRQNDLIKKIQMKELITHGIKKMMNEKFLNKREMNAQRYLSKQDHINKLKKMDEYGREQKYINYIERENKRGKVNNIKNRIYSSRVYRMNDMAIKRKKDIQKIQRILKNGEGEDEENLDLLMEEFPDNPRIAEIIREYQMKKSDIENNLKPRLYSSKYNSNINNMLVSGYNRTLMNNAGSKSTDKKRIFIYANDKMNTNKIRNDEIKKEERRINNTSNMHKTSSLANNVNAIVNVVDTRESKMKAFKERYPDFEEDEDDDEDYDDNQEIVYEHEIDNKVRSFKVKIYKNFLKKLKTEKRHERLRKKQLEIITDDILRKNMEIQFSKERTLVDLRLKKESERIQKQAKDYENNLRSNFRRKQARFMNIINVNKRK